MMEREQEYRSTKNKPKYIQRVRAIVKMRTH